MRKIQWAKVIAVMALSGVLGAGAARADGGKPGDRACADTAPGISLCAKVGATMHTCVRDQACEKKSAAKKRSRGGLGFLSRLFI